MQLGDIPEMTTIEFIKGKLAEAEHKLKLRQESEKVWRSGTDKSWRKAGSRMTREERLRVAAMDARIAIKNRKEVEMFRDVLNQLENPVCPVCL